MVDDALIMTSELVTNAVVHGRAELQVSLHRTTPALWVAVADKEPALPVLPDEPLDPTRVSGRGLYIVNRLATTWGVDLLDGTSGKTVWFRLNID